MRSVRRPVLLVTLLMTVPVGYAAAQEEASPWKGKAELSYVRTSGNTDTETLAAKMEGAADYSPNRYYAKAAALFAKNDGNETSNRWFLGGRYERGITERLFGFAAADYLKDEFAGFDSRISFGPGLGYEFIQTQAHHLRGLASILYVHENYVNDGTDSYLSGKAEGNYTWLISENVKFLQNLDYQVSFEDAGVYFINSETKVETKLRDNLAVAVSYLIGYQGDPPEGSDRMDRTFLTSLVLDF